MRMTFRWACLSARVGALTARPPAGRKPLPEPARKPRLPRERKPLPARKPPRPLARPLANRKIDAFLFAAALIVLAFVASNYFRRTAMSDPAPVNIFISWQYWEMFGYTANLFVREFEEQNPGFRIVMAAQEDMARGNPGDKNLDIVFFDDSEFAALLEASALASLSPYIYTETEEDQWALPLVAFVDLFFYNIDILQMAGNDRPPRTRAEFLAAARSVAQAAANSEKEFFPFAFGLSEVDASGIRRDFNPWVWALGAEVHSGFTADGALALTAPTTATINFFAEMNREGLIAPGSFDTTGRERLEQFAEGKIAMMVASARDMLFLRDSPREINFDVTAIPAAALGRNRLGLSGIYAGISSASERPDVAWDFLVFIAGRTHLLEAALGAVPGSFFINFPGRHIQEDPLRLKAWEIFQAADIVEFQSSDFSGKEASLVIRERLAQAFGENPN